MSFQKRSLSQTSFGSASESHNALLGESNTKRPRLASAANGADEEISWASQICERTARLDLTETPKFVSDTDPGHIDDMMDIDDSPSNKDTGTDNEFVKAHEIQQEESDDEESELIGYYHQGTLEGTVDGKPWVGRSIRGVPLNLYGPDSVYAQRPQDFYWTCCDESPYSEGCELEDSNMPSWCKEFVIDTIIDAFDFGEILDDEVKEVLRILLWDDL